MTLTKTALLLAAVRYISVPAWAQTDLSTIRGTASDPTGAVVANAKITVVDLETNIQRTTVTNDNGDFEAPDLKRGTYRLTATSAGFKTFVADNILLESGQIRRINVTFELGAVGTEVTVQADAAVISTDSAKISSGYSHQKYDATPMVGNLMEPTHMLTILPNVQSPMGGYGLRFAGISSSQAQMAMDGHTNDGAVNLINNMEDTQEISAVMVNNSAEFARVGYFNMITKSGTNHLHGRLFYYNENSALFARAFFDPQKTKFLTHTMGGQASGPIKKDKTFFYASWSGQRRTGKSFNLRTVPTAAMRGGDFSQLLAQSRPVILRDPLSGAAFPGNTIPASRFDPVTKKVLDKYIPAPNLGAPDSLARNFGFLFPYINDNYKSDWVTARVDHKISNNNTLYGRFTLDRYPYVLPGNYPGLERTRLRPNHHVVVEDTHIFSPAVVNTFRLGLYKEGVIDGTTIDGHTPPKGDQAVKDLGIQGVNPRGLSAQGFPRMDITGYPSVMVVPGGETQNDHNWGFSDSVTWTRGRHVLKFGGEYKPQSRFNGQVPEGTYGVFGFNGTFTTHAFADFLLGLPFSSQRLDPLTNRTLLDSELGIYAQDSFKVNSRLTLDLGLRWDHFGPTSFEDGLLYNWDPVTGNVIVPSDATKGISPLYPTNTIKVIAGRAKQDPSLRNFAPRLGVAYRPFGDKMVIRAGYGIFTETLGRYARLLSGGPFQISETFFNTIQDGKPLFTFPNPFPATGSGNIPSQSISGYPINTENGRIHQFNVTLERQLHNVGLRLSYIGDRARGTNYSVNINKPQASLIPFSASRRPYSQFVNATFTRNNGSQNYNAVTFEAQRKAGQFTFDAHWTWASNYLNYQSIEDPYAPLQWSREPFTSRHRVVFNAVWDLPLGRGQRFLTNAPSALNHIVGGWQLFWIGYLQTGQFFTPSFSGSDPSNTNTSGGRPDRIANGNLPPDQRKIDHWFDTAAFAVPPGGRYGNSGVNILEGPGLNVDHLSVSKRFRLSERLTLQYMLAISDVFNHPNFAFPNSNVSVPGLAGVIDGDYGDLTMEKASHRRMEMRLRLDF